MRHVLDLRVSELKSSMMPGTESTKHYGPITTEILPSPALYHAEDYHQQYLAKNPGGYCELGGTGVSCSIGVAL